MKTVFPVNEICVHVDDLLDAYALDALELDERTFVDRHLPGCLQQRDRLEELQEVATIIGRAIPLAPPPPAVWQRLLTETGGGLGAAVRPPVVGLMEPSLVAVPAHRGNVISLNRWVAWAGGIAAALLLASTVALGAALQRSDRDVDAGAVDPLMAMVARGGDVVPLSTQPQPAELTDVGQGSILTAPGMQPAVVVDHWTPSTDSLRYIVWMAAADGSGTIVLGEITINQDGHGMLILKDVTTFAGYGIFGISIKTTEGAALQDVLLGTPPAQVG